MTVHEDVVKDAGGDGRIRGSKLSPRPAASMSESGAADAVDAAELGASSSAAAPAIDPEKEARVYARSELLHVAAVRVAQQRSGSPPSKPHGRGKDVVSTIAGVDPNHVGADRQALGQSGTPPTGMMYSGGETGWSPLSTGVSESNASLEKDSPPPRHAFMGGGNGKRGIWRAAEGGARQREFSFGWDGGEVVVGGGGKGEGYYQAPVAVTSQPVRRAEDKILDRSGGIEEARGGPAPPPSHEVLAWLSCLFCCCPIGAIAILRAREVPRRYRAGDHEGALRSSVAAHKWSVVAIGVGLFFTIVRVGLYFLYNKYSCTYLCIF